MLYTELGDFMMTIQHAFRVSLFGALLALVQLAGAIYLRHGNVERLTEVRAELDAAGEGPHSRERHIREEVLSTRIDMHRSTMLWSSLYTLYFLIIALAIHRGSKGEQ